jgi:hypothetical protein
MTFNAAEVVQLERPASSEIRPLNVADRVTTRLWELDLSMAGKVYSPTKRPPKRKRQTVARFLGREGGVERFSIRQTIPYCGYEVECFPSQSQYGAVCDFFVDGCETRFQAHTLLSARDYAEVITKSSGAAFTAPRRRFIWICAAAFILSDKDLRSRVRSWSEATWSKGWSASNRNFEKAVKKFVARLIDDMRAEGAEIFG